MLFMVLKGFNALNSYSSHSSTILFCWLVLSYLATPPVVASWFLITVVTCVISLGPSRFCILMTGLTLVASVFTSAICSRVPRMAPLDTPPDMSSIGYFRCYFASTIVNLGNTNKLVSRLTGTISRTNALMIKSMKTLINNDRVD